MSGKLGAFLTLCFSMLFAQSPTTSANDTPGTPRILATKSNGAVANDSGSPEQSAAGAMLFYMERDLWVINSDGSGLKKLTNSTAADLFYSVAWSPDGSKTAYINYRRLEGSTAASVNWWVMNADGSAFTPLTGFPNRVVHELAWSPDSRKLAAVTQLFDLDKEMQVKYLANNILVMNADGSGGTPLTRFTSPNSYVEHPTWSPDGRRIAFVSNSALDVDDKNSDNARRNLWVMDADGSHAIPLTKLTEKFPRIREVAWSPDSQRVTYISSRVLDGSDAGGGGTNIWVSNADGSGSFPLTRFKHATCNAFSWSPDGSRLTFSSNDSLDGGDTGTPSLNIWVLKMDGSAPMPLTHETIFERSNDRPAWSPGGSSIAFVSCIHHSSAKVVPFNVCKLSIMNADGSGVRQLTEQSVELFQWRR
jgi:Tol biopolymer transport system component